MSPDPMLERILADKRSMTTTQVAKGYGMTARKLNALLEQAGIQRKVNGSWELCTAHLKRGLVTINEYPFMHRNGSMDCTTTMKWTPIGRLQIHDIIQSQSTNRRESHATTKN